MSKIKAIATTSSIDVMYETLTKERKVVQCEYVGCSQNDFIILRYPASMAPRCNTDPFSAGRIINLRAIVNLNSQEIVTFSSSILKTMTTSERLLFISYPKKFESKVLRAEPRLKVELMAELLLDDMQIKSMLCLITDVSPSGIGCEFHMQSEHDNSNFKELINKKCTLNVDMSVYGVNTPYKLNATIKNINKKAKTQLGLFFDEENKKQLRILFEKLAIENIMY